MHRYPLPPSGNRYWRVGRGRIYPTDEGQNYKATVAMMARCDRVELLTGPVAVDVAVYRARKSGDLDNFLKILLDAMQGVYYHNDSQVIEIHATLQDDKHAPRVEVSVRSCRR